MLPLKLHLLCYTLNSVYLWRKRDRNPDLDQAGHHPVPSHPTHIFYPQFYIPFYFYLTLRYTFKN